MAVDELDRNLISRVDLADCLRRSALIALPLNPQLRDPEYELILGEARPRVLAVQEEYRDLAMRLAGSPSSPIQHVYVTRSSVTSAAAAVRQQGEGGRVRTGRT